MNRTIVMVCLCCALTSFRSTVGDLADSTAVYRPAAASDMEVTDEDLRSHHIVLIGRPSTNKLASQLKSALPFAFDPQSFAVRGKTYAHPGTAIACAFANPGNPRFGITLIAGLSEGSAMKGLLGGALGMVIGTIGVAPIGGETRFTFGLTVLQGGVAMIVALIGLFVLPELFIMAARGKTALTAIRL